MDELILLQWKEVNENIRHWEKLLFENARSFFTIVSLSVAAAGAVIAWPAVPRTVQLVAILVFLFSAIGFSLSAMRAIWSTRNYLSRFYARRAAIETSTPGLMLREPPPKEDQGTSGRTKKSGETVTAVYDSFGIAILISLALIVAALVIPSRSILNGANLSGADLSSVRGLTSHDLEGACGDERTKLPTGINIRPCTLIRGSSGATQPGAAGDAPRAARP
jgi:hypothetical protein